MNPKRHLKHIATVALATLIAIVPVVSASAATNYPEHGRDTTGVTKALAVRKFMVGSKIGLASHKNAVCWN